MQKREQNTASQCMQLYRKHLPDDCSTPTEARKLKKSIKMKLNTGTVS